MNIFGIEITRRRPQPPTSVVAPLNDDGSTVISSATAGYYAQVMELEAHIKSENDLIRRYREIAAYSDCDSAIEDICNEAIVSDDVQSPVEINLDDLLTTDSIKKKIADEFKNVMALLDFNNKGHDIFRSWYIDGRIYFHIIVDEKNPGNGIAELRPIDPRKVRKIRSIQKTRVNTGVDIVKNIDEYYLYNDAGITETSITGVKLHLDSVVYTPSGLVDPNTTLTLSYLHKAIKLVNQLKMMEDALVIYRISRAPERRIFYVDVGNLPKIKAEQYVNDLMNKFRNKVVYDACLDMNTRIPLLDGRTLTLYEMQKEFEDGRELWVYSCNPTTGEFAPGLVTSAGITKFNQQVMRLTLDNGESITCTPDHKFPVWNRGTVEAKDLIIGDSMLPFYSRTKSIMKGKSEYNQLFKNDTKKWEFTHRLVSKWKDKLALDNEFVFNKNFDNEKKLTVHHKNYNRFDNSPSNLVKMNNKDHLHYHTQHNGLAGKIGGKVTAARKKAANIPYFNLTKEQQSEQGRRNGSIVGPAMVLAQKGIHDPSNKAKYGKIGNDALQIKLKDAEFNKKFCSAISNGWKPEQRKAQAIKSSMLPNSHFANMGKLGNVSRWDSEKGKDNRLSLSKKMSIIYPDYMKDLLNECARLDMIGSSAVQYINSKIDFLEWQDINKSITVKNRSILDSFTYKDLTRISIQMGFSGYKEYKESIKLRNHKIIKIEYLNDLIDVGTLGIDKDEIYHDYHTFALESGIYTCNSTGEVRDDRKHLSMLEDFWMPRREGGKGTEISTLPGGQTLGQIDDIIYFQEKLYQALQVPTSHLKNDTGFNIGRASEITRDEIKFNKFVQRIRKKFAGLFYDILRMQLILKGIINPEDWDDIKEFIRFNFMRDNYYTEIKENEILNSRLATLQQIDPFVGKYFSIEWTRKNVLMQTDDDMVEMDKQRTIDRQNELENARHEGEVQVQQQAPMMDFQAANAPPEQSFQK